PGVHAGGQEGCPDRVRNGRRRVSLDRAQSGERVRVLRAVRHDPDAGDQVGDLARGRAAGATGPGRGRPRRVRGPGRGGGRSVEGCRGTVARAIRYEGRCHLSFAIVRRALGTLRSEELLAARRIDGARQFFTRAYDFGYSKTLDEALRLWPRDSVLKDVLDVVRRFRPQIIVSVFSGTPRDGHGQHQVAG